MASPIELLPIEIRQAILGSLTDITSLKQCALSCPTLYSAYKAMKRRKIIARVLYNQIGSGVLPEAVMALSSSRLRFIDLESFTSRNFRERKPAQTIYTFKHALLISNLHVSVEFLVKDFVRKTFAASPFASPAELVMPASRAEIDRIERAFYMFEIYRNMFTRHNRYRQWRAEAQQEALFKYFSAWENEQLACVHDYLVQLVTPTFNEIAAHDVLWGSTNVEYATSPDSEYVQAILSRGLAHLHEIAKAESYSARRKLIYKPYPPRCELFLTPSMVDSQPAHDAYRLSSLPSAVDIVLTPAFFKGDDGGPEDAWRWAYKSQEVALLFDASKRRRQVRRWAYVMWDRARLDRWGVFEKRWVDTLIVPSKEETELEREEGERTKAEMRSSWKRRELVHLAGGYGWWAADSEGSVKWLNHKSSPWDDEAKRAECDLCIGAVKCAPHRLVLRLRNSC